MFLLYINDLPQYLKFTTPGLYADDTQIFASSDNYDELVDLLNSDLKNISRWLSDNKLQHHTTKTKLMFIGSRYNIKNKIGDKLVICKNKPLKRYRSFKCLGVELDEHLTALPSPGFYPEISGFFEADGIFLGSFFKKSISGFFWDF